MVAPLLILNQILTAGNTITAFSLLLYALTFNLRERVARSLAILLACVTLVYFGDVLVATAPFASESETWLRLQWVGISFVPAAYLQLSDALLAATGRPSRGRRSRVVLLSYVIGGLALLEAAFGRRLAGKLRVIDSAAYLSPGPFFWIFTAFLLVTIVFAALNFWRAYERCLTRSSRRRMRYLLAGSIGPLLGSFPFLMLGGQAFVTRSIFFWGTLIVINAFVAVQMIMMSYSVAYFGVAIPDRVVKSRLFQWILRGPVVASTVLAITVVVNRLGVLIGYENSRVVPFAMVATLLLLQYVITLIRRPIERWFFIGEDRYDVARLQMLEERLLTTGDLRQFLESLLNATCDVVGRESAFIAIVGPEGLELEVSVGPDNPLRGSEEMPPFLVTQDTIESDRLGVIFSWDDYWLLPLRLENPSEVIGFMGVPSDGKESKFSVDEEERLQVLLERASIALAEKKLQREVFAVMDRLVPQVEAIQKIRAEARFAGTDALTGPIEGIGSEEELANLVKDALGHYWGGPR
ncbi:MAG: histidine kinase N-terminal 7TM domain-containing protein, partial [Anaerolineales bacterium]